MDQYVSLAEEAIEKYVKNNIIIDIPKNLPSDFYNRKSGIFITIRKGEELRGCIGTFLPTKKNIAEEIIHNAVAACSRDHRFTPITERELPSLNYEVSLLSQPMILEEINQHDPKKNGIIVQCKDGRAGLLLPDLEGIDTVEKQISIACQKGGIKVEADDISLYNFTVEKHL